MNTLMPPCACMNVAPSMQTMGICSTSHAAVTGMQEKTWTWGVVSVWGELGLGPRASLPGLWRA